MNDNEFGFDDINGDNVKGDWLFLTEKGEVGESYRTKTTVEERPHLVCR